VRGFRSRDPTHVWVLALSYYRYSDVKVPVRLGRLCCVPERERKVPEVVRVVNCFFSRTMTIQSFGLESER